MQAKRTAADPALVEAWRPMSSKRFDRLDAARERSVVPEEPRNVEPLARCLLALRKARF